jgi:isopentenyl-diphosphate delta-isomerase
MERRMSETIGARKDSHLDLCLTGDVEGPGVSALWDDVSLVHDALTELSWDQVDLAASMLGRSMRAPLLVVGMTGGTERAGQVNRDLARAAQSMGVAFGVGSQRPMLLDASSVTSYRVRDAAPDVPVFGNLGARQLIESGVDAACGLVEAIEADGLFVHLNVAQELVQPGGDRAFGGSLDAIRRLVDRLGPKVWVKETGCGLSPSVLRRLIAAGVGGVDVSGAGGTSWTRVEMLRAAGVQQQVGRALSGWGIPTAAAVAASGGLGVPVVASGGVRSGLDVAKALALGASHGGLALPFLKAQAAGGWEAVAEAIDAVVSTLRATMLLTGSRDVAALQRAPRVLTGTLPAWIDSLTGVR